MNTISRKNAVSRNQTDQEIADGDFVVQDAGCCVLAVEKTMDDARVRADEIECEFDRECFIFVVVD